MSFPNLASMKTSDLVLLLAQYVKTPHLDKDDCDFIDAVRDELKRRKPMGHPNLSDDINRRIEQSEIDGGAWMEKLAPGKTLHVQTKNTHYEITRDAQGNERIKGNPTFCPDFFACSIQGSTWGTSMLKVGYVGVGMRLEVVLLEGPHTGGTMLTTQI